MNKQLGFFLQRAFYVLVAYLPFQVALNLAADIDLMSGRVLIIGLFFVWMLVFYWDKNKCGLLFEGEVSFWLVAFFVFAAVSIIAAGHQSWGLRKLLFLTSIFLLFWPVKFLMRRKKEQLLLIYIFAGGVAVSCSVALAQFLAQFVFGSEAVATFWSAKILPLFSGASLGALVASNPSWQVFVGGQTIMRAVGLFPDPHMLAFYIGIVSPFVLTLLFFEKRYKFVFFVIYCLSFAVLLLTFSRGGYLGLVISLAAFFLFAGPFFRAGDKKFFGICFLTMAAVLLLFGWPVMSRLFSSFSLSEGSNAGRLAIWQDSWEIIKKNPVTGVGLGNYSAEVKPGQDYRNAITSHNLYLDIMAETGLFGLLSWLLLFFAAVKKSIRKISEGSAVFLGALSSLAYFFVHSFFETAIFNPTVLAFLMVVLGLAASGNAVKDGARPARR